MSARHLRITVLAAAIFAASVLTSEGQADRPAPRAPGEQSRWSLTFSVRLEQTGGTTPIEIRLSGDWTSTISAVRKSGYDAALQLSNTRVAGQGVSSVADAVAGLEQRLTRTFWATYREDGSLLSLHFLKDVDPSDRNLLQLIATHTQLVGLESMRPVWTVLERDGAGAYLAIYHRPEANLVAKRKLKYIETDGAAGTVGRALTVAIEQSELRFALDAESGVAALDGTEQVRMFFPTAATDSAERSQLAARVETHLASPRRSRNLELIGSLDRARPDVVSSPVVTHTADPESALATSDRSLLDGYTTESLLEAAAANSGDRMLSERLAALFRSRPEASAAALQVLRKGGARKSITDALGTAGSPPAIEALGSLARDQKMPIALRRDALNALVLNQHPSPEATRIPVALLDDSDADVRSTARLISGAVARAGRVAWPGEAEAVDAALVTRYRKARDTEDMIELLGGLGNSVGPQAVKVIKEALGDDRESVRAAAARALRLAPGPDVDGLLAAAITSDSHPAVRADAIFAAGFRRPLSPQIGEALLRVAWEDPIGYVRSNAVTLLRRNAGVVPGIAETLVWIADHDSKPAIRRLAREALASFTDRR
jgi:HEAT repeat protein